MGHVTKIQIINVRYFIKSSISVAKTSKKLLKLGYFGFFAVNRITQGFFNKPSTLCTSLNLENCYYNADEVTKLP